ncbi:hypothetical protein HY623_02095 [Candidatus Uhrbacteria bacterium]|nr:hypothetical protein [Candidatus Uhrbacteria bacterium]
MYLFIHAAEREYAYLLLVGKSMPRTTMRGKELLEFLTFGDLVVYTKYLVYRGKKSPDVLRGIDDLLNQFGLAAKSLKGICVLSGPGQFSFLRTSVVTANTFGWALNIPVVGICDKKMVSGSKKMVSGTISEEIEPDTIFSDTIFSHNTILFITRGLKKLSRTKRFRPVVPEYGREPNITTPKKRI